MCRFVVLERKGANGFGNMVEGRIKSKGTVLFTTALKQGRNDGFGE